MRDVSKSSKQPKLYKLQQPIWRCKLWNVFTFRDFFLSTGCLKQSQNNCNFDRNCKPLQRVHGQVNSSWQIWWYTCWARTRAAANAWLWWASCGLAACKGEHEEAENQGNKRLFRPHLRKFAHAAYSPGSHAALISRLLAATLATRPQWRRCEHKRARLSEKWTVVFSKFGQEGLKSMTSEEWFEKGLTAVGR